MSIKFLLILIIIGIISQSKQFYYSGRFLIIMAIIMQIEYISMDNNSPGQSHPIIMSLRGIMGDYNDSIDIYQLFGKI
jgi:uncharacterized membrane protein (DUF441 family)